MIAACNNRTGEKAATDDTVEVKSEEQQVTMAVDTVHNAATSLDIAGTYEGTLPCADCPGIITTVTLNKDNSYAIKRKYIDRQSDFESKGTWKVEKNTLTLNGENSPEKYRVEENRLIQLDGNGNRIEGDIANRFILTKK